MLFCCPLGAVLRKWFVLDVYKSMMKQKQRPSCRCRKLSRSWRQQSWVPVSSPWVSSFHWIHQELLHRPGSWTCPTSPSCSPFYSCESSWSLPPRCWVAHAYILRLVDCCGCEKEVEADELGDLLGIRGTKSRDRSVDQAFKQQAIKTYNVSRAPLLITSSFLLRRGRFWRMNS